MRLATIQFLTVFCVCSALLVTAQSNQTSHFAQFGQNKKKTDKKGTDTPIDPEKVGGSQLMLKGKVDSVDRESNSMKVTQGKSSYKILFDDSTSITMSHKEAKVQDLNEGSSVSVSGSRTAKGDIKASKIEIRDRI